MRETQKGFMCSTDFDTELGMDCNEARVYPTLAKLERDRKCIVEGEQHGHRTDCGIYEVEVKIVRVVKPANF